MKNARLLAALAILLAASASLAGVAYAQFTSPTCVPPACNPSVIQNISLTGSPQTANINLTGSAAFSGNVGVGTTTTGNAKLYVNGATAGNNPNVQTTGDVLLGSGGSLFFDGNYSYASGNYIRPVAANTQQFVTAGAERMRIDSAGNVGIGTASPGAKLEVAGQVKITGGAPGAGKVLTSDASGLASWQTPSVGGGGTITGVGTANRVSKWLSGTDLGDSSIFDDGTKVGIGTTTPLYKLTVEGNDASNGLIVAKNTSNGTAMWANSSGGFGLYAQSDAYAGVYGYSGGPAGIGRGVWGYSSDSYGVQGQSGYIGVYGTGGNGIGVYGSASTGVQGTGAIGVQGVASTSGVSSGIGVRGDSDTDGTPSGVMGYSGSATGRGVSGIATNGVGVYADGATWGFYTPDGAYAGGNVGIGTETPNNKLQVAGLISFDDTDKNTFLGSGAGAPNLGSENVGVGYHALNVNAEGSSNTAVGAYALRLNTTGSQNSAFGAGALGGNTTGLQNSAVGYNALTSNGIGGYNTAFGYSALAFNTSGAYNTAIGWGALYFNTIGYENAAVGFQALYSNINGYNNVAVGRQALSDITTGHGNVAVGQYAGQNSAISLNSNTNSTFIGYNASASSSNLTNSTAIGYGARADASNQIVLGNTSITQTVVNGRIKITGGTPGAGKVLTSDADGLATWESPATGGTDGPPLAITRATVAYNATLATKDAACAAEYGTSYRTATIVDLNANWMGTKPVASTIYGYSYSITAGLVASTNNKGVIQANNPASSNDTGIFNEISMTLGSLPVVCVKNANRLEFTRATVAYNATLATKDAACAAEYGTSYRTATIVDLNANWMGTKPVASTIYGYSYSITAGLVASTNNKGVIQANNPASSNDTGIFNEISMTLGSLPVVCVHK